MAATRNAERRRVLVGLTCRICLLVLALPAVSPNRPDGAAGQGQAGAPLPGSSRLFASDTSWKQYQQIVPQMRSRSHPSLHEDVHVDPSPGSLGLAAEKRKPMTLMLDLDKTCLFGNDSNDLALSLQCMGRPQGTVFDLYKRVLSPSIRQAYDSYVAGGREVEVVIYTRRPQLLLYRSVDEDRVVQLKYLPDWHDAGNQLHIPPSMRDADHVFSNYRGPFLTSEERNDVVKGLERLLCARDAIALELGLSSLPPVVVTARAKDIDMTARHLSLDPTTAVLYDDNVELSKDSRVVLVEPYTRVPEAHRQELLRFMQAALPTHELDSQLLKYLESAEPSEQCLKFAKGGKVSWWVPLSARGVESHGIRTPEIESWKILPHLIQARAPSTSSATTHTQTHTHALSDLSVPSPRHARGLSDTLSETARRLLHTICCDRPAEGTDASGQGGEVGDGHVGLRGSALCYCEKGNCKSAQDFVSRVSLKLWDGELDTGSFSPVTESEPSSPLPEKRGLESRSAGKRDLIRYANIASPSRTPPIARLRRSPSRYTDIDDDIIQYTDIDTDIKQYKHSYFERKHNGELAALLVQHTTNHCNTLQSFREETDHRTPHRRVQIWSKRERHKRSDYAHEYLCADEFE